MLTYFSENKMCAKHLNVSNEVMLLIGESLENEDKVPKPLKHKVRQYKNIVCDGYRAIEELKQELVKAKDGKEFDGLLRDFQFNSAEFFLRQMHILDEIEEIYQKIK